jgi:hypothetical protein
LHFVLDLVKKMVVHVTDASHALNVQDINGHLADARWLVDPPRIRVWTTKV